MAQDPAQDPTPPAAWMTALADDAGVVFVRLRTTPQVQIEYVNDALDALLGVTATEARTDSHALLDRISTADAPLLNAALSMDAGDSRDLELHWCHRDGRVVPTRVRLRCHAGSDGSTLVEGTLVPSTQSKEAKRALEHSEERHRLLVENAWDVIWTMALDGTITYVSPSVERVRGISPEEAKAQTLEQIHPPESAARVVDYYGRLFAAIQDGSEPPVFRGEQEYYRKDGSIMTGELQVIPHVDADGRVVEILGVTRDVSDRRRYEEEMTRLAITDALTGTWNRRHAEEILAAELDQARRYGSSLALLMIDLDHFKEVNDNFGHATGDRVLVAFGQRLTERLRAADMLARWGGEEFVVLLRNCALDDAVGIAEQIRALVADEPVGDVGRITVSIGAAELTDEDDLASWVARADRALYDAKRSGRNAVRS